MIMPFQIPKIWLQILAVLSFVLGLAIGLAAIYMAVNYEPWTWQATYVYLQSIAGSAGLIMIGAVFYARSRSKRI